MNRNWLITWTTYGTWLPGDRRGFVSPLVDSSGRSVLHNIPGTTCDADLPALARARGKLKCPAIYLATDQSQVLLNQFRETAFHRHWTLRAAAIMANHVHIVVEVTGDPDSADILRDFKSYASRALNQQWSRPASGTWWTESGSRRKLPNQRAVAAAVRYVERQKHAHVIWSENGGRYAAEIAIAVVKHNGRFLVGQRPDGVPLAGMWEFPGGKILPGETPQHAAVRECLEETGLQVSVAGLYSEHKHRYEHGAVHLHFFDCRCLEARERPLPPFRWIEAAELANLTFPAANAELIFMLSRSAGSNGV